MKIFTTNLYSLELDLAEVYRTMGSENYVPDKNMVLKVEDTIKELAGVCLPRYGYSVFDTGLSSDGLSIDGVNLNPGNIITPFLSGIEQTAVFVATAGKEYEEWSENKKNSGDILEQFIADAVGSEIAEAASREVWKELEKEVKELQLGLSSPYSPGYCGWQLNEQRILFDLLPADPCGIKLNSSFLMLPIKSVSGIIGIGKNMKKNAYGCDICRKKDCYKKRLH